MKEGLDASDILNEMPTELEMIQRDLLKTGFSEKPKYYMVKFWLEQAASFHSLVLDHQNID